MEPEDIFQVGVKILLTSREDKILLLWANSSSAYWDFPGGRVRRKENFPAALARELYEETGVQLDPADLHFLGAHMTGIRIPYGEADAGLIFFMYKCQLHEHVGLTLSPEHTDFWWASRAETAHEMKTTIPESFIRA